LKAFKLYAPVIALLIAGCAGGSGGVAGGALPGVTGAAAPVDQGNAHFVVLSVSANPGEIDLTAQEAGLATYLKKNSKSALMAFTAGADYHVTIDCLIDNSHVHKIVTFHRSATFGPLTYTSPSVSNGQFTGSLAITAAGSGDEQLQCPASPTSGAQTLVGISDAGFSNATLSDSSAPGTGAPSVDLSPLLNATPTPAPTATPTV